MITRALPLPFLAAGLLLSGCASSPTDSPTHPPDSAENIDILPSSPAAAIADAIAPAGDFTAAVSEITNTGSQGDYAAVATFTTAQGRDFDFTVEDAASGQLLANTTVTGINSAAHSQSLPFRHTGSLSTLVVRIIDKESGRELDRWSPR